MRRGLPSLRRSRRPAVGLAGVVVGAALVVLPLVTVVPPAAASTPPASGSSTPTSLRATPYLRAVVRAVRKSERTQGVSFEGRAWQVTQGNALPGLAKGSWLLQTPGCWGDPPCANPSGQHHLLKTLQQTVARAKHLVDITGLLPYPSGGFEQAIAAGLRTSYAAGHNPLVRVLYGSPPGSDIFSTAPAAYLALLRRDVGPLLPADAKIAVADYRSTLQSWDHEKDVVVDGRTVISGGVNFWPPSYLQTKNPVTDASMQLRGPAALSATRFVDVLWGFGCAHLGSIKVAYAATPATGSCPATEAPSLAGAATARPGKLTVLGLGQLGVGIVHVPGRNRRPRGVTASDLANASCTVLGVRLPDETNDSTRYDAANPAAVGLRALIGSARHSVYISQQDMMGICPPQANYDVRLFKAIAGRIAARVPVTIVLTNPGAQLNSGASYSTGAPLSAVTKALLRYVRQDVGGSRRARSLVCSNLRFAPLRTSDSIRGWPNATGRQALPALHSKIVMVDKQAFYIGSHNAYPAYLQEYGYMVDQHRAASVLYQQFFKPEWRYSSKVAVVNPATHTCNLG
jgi:phosphatidylserine/phosphatidylglycerophosphate/cardiolipin synthase-like enzyme